MLSAKDEQELVVLRAINSADQPLGSGAVREELRRAGSDVSEATVGRLLRDMDFRGLTERVGFQGRVLTEEGKQRLSELEREKERNRYGFELINALRLKDKDGLLEVLVARRAIESEIARLAAIHATPEEIDTMHHILDVYQRQVEEGYSGARQDVAFHKALAQSARNKVLGAAMDLIRQDGQLSPVLEYIRKRVKRVTLVTDHRKILEAVERRLPEEAARAMNLHLEGLIADVEKYWALAQNEDSYQYMPGE
ncbi:hypothetical protein SY88_03880 [Clostridiales bacterium PH28_bin88]|nr:hypothetical protein SY88_03880 [Clostridiales bacterium PH28_bin88]